MDPWLEPHKEALKARYNYAQSWIKRINETEGGLEKFSRVRFPFVFPLFQFVSDQKQGYERFGLNVNDCGDITYREWAPNAVEAHLIGDFSMQETEPWFKTALMIVDNWDRRATPMTRDPFGVWEVTLPSKNGMPVIPHNSRVKVRPAHVCVIYLQLMSVDHHGYPRRRSHRQVARMDQARYPRSQRLSCL